MQGASRKLFRLQKPWNSWTIDLWSQPPARYSKYRGSRSTKVDKSVLGCARRRYCIHFFVLRASDFSPRVWGTCCSLFSFLFSLPSLCVRVCVCVSLSLSHCLSLQLLSLCLYTCICSFYIFMHTHPFEFIGVHRCPMSRGLPLSTRSAKSPELF